MNWLLKLHRLCCVGLCARVRRRELVRIRLRARVRRRELVRIRLRATLLIRAGARNMLLIRAGARNIIRSNWLSSPFLTSEVLLTLELRLSLF